MVNSVLQFTFKPHIAACCTCWQWSTCCSTSNTRVSSFWHTKEFQIIWSTFGWNKSAKEWVRGNGFKLSGSLSMKWEGNWNPDNVPVARPDLNPQQPSAHMWAEMQNMWKHLKPTFSLPCGSSSLFWPFSKFLGPTCPSAVPTDKTWTWWKYSAPKKTAN